MSFRTILKRIWLEINIFKYLIWIQQNRTGNRFVFRVCAGKLPKEIYVCAYSKT